MRRLWCKPIHISQWFGISTINTNLWFDYNRASILKCLAVRLELMNKLSLHYGFFSGFLCEFLQELPINKTFWLWWHDARIYASRVPGNVIPLTGFINSLIYWMQWKICFCQNTRFCPSLKISIRYENSKYLNKKQSRILIYSNCRQTI